MIVARFVLYRKGWIVCIRNIECMEKRISSSCVNCLDGSIVILKRTGILCSLPRYELAKPRATSISLLVDKKLLNEINPPSICLMRL